MNTPERIMVAKSHPFKEPDDLYVCHPRLQHPAAVEFTRADLCADPALLAEAVEVLRGLLIAADGDSYGDYFNAIEAGHAFLAKLENRHE